MPTNALLNPSLITQETLVMLENNLVAAGKVNRQFEPQFVKIGQSLTIRKPNRFTITSGPGLNVQNISEPSTSITISNQKHVDFQFSSADLTLTIEEFSERYCKPAAAELANQVDYDTLTNTFSFSNLVGSPGTVPATYAALAAVGQRMDELGVPQDGRCLLLNPAAYWSMTTGLTGLYVRSAAEPALKGFLANIANFSIYLDQNVQSHTNGLFGGTGKVNGANQTGSSIITNGWTGSVTNLFLPGDVITLAGVNQTNSKAPRASTGQLKNFVITAAVNSDSGGNATLPIFPAINISGAYQNATAAPANLAGVTVLSGTGNTAYFNNIAFVRDAIGLVTVPLVLPDGVDFRAQEMYKGMSMRIIRAYDINNDVLPCRIDMLYGTAMYYDDLAVRLTN